MLPIAEDLPSEEPILEAPTLPMFDTMEVEQGAGGDHRPFAVPGLTELLGPEGVTHLMPCSELDRLHGAHSRFLRRNSPTGRLASRYA